MRANFVVSANCRSPDARACARARHAPKTQILLGNSSDDHRQRTVPRVTSVARQVFRAFFCATRVTSIVTAPEFGQSLFTLISHLRYALDEGIPNPIGYAEQKTRARITPAIAKAKR
jgi:hypothetical protein